MINQPESTEPFNIHFVTYDEVARTMSNCSTGHKILSARILKYMTAEITCSMKTHDNIEPIKL